MRRSSSPTRAGRAPHVSAVPERGPELPAWKAFVVQFSRRTAEGPDVFAGRVEHLSSGRRVRFGSAEELVATLTKLLDSIDQSAK